MAGKDFPYNFDVRADPVFQESIKPFIEDELLRLKQFDEKRIAWAKANLPPDYKVNYLFHSHAFRVADDMRRTAAHMGQPEHVCENLYWAMLAHDIGKSRLPVDLWDIIKKPENAIKAQRRSHTDEGEKAVRAALDFKHSFIDLMTDIMRNHHEQMDGNGHRGLKGSELSPAVRLACIIESFDGYAIARPHFGDRDISIEGVLKRMREEKGAAHYDMNLFEAFAETKMTGYKNVKDMSKPWTSLKS